MKHTPSQQADDELNKKTAMSLLDTYIMVCNCVLEANENRFPYSHIWAASERSLGNTLLEFQVKSCGEVVSAYYVFHNIHLDPAKEGGAGFYCKKLSKQFSETYLKSVIREPYKYIVNPSLINWDWMNNGTHIFEPAREYKAKETEYPSHI